MLGSLAIRPEAKLLALLSLASVIRGDCGPPPKLKNAVHVTNIEAVSFPTDTVVDYKCLTGFYNIHGKLDVTTCLSNSQWSYIEDFCESTCPAPIASIYARPNPEMELRSFFPPGTTVTYICRQGYDTIPGINPLVTCLQNNTWSEIPVLCKGKSCGNPGKPQNGRAIILTDILYRAKVNFICDEGYRLIGLPFIQCTLKSGIVRWNKDPPDCQPITCSSPPNITGGTHDGGEGIENFAYNSTLTYTCNNGSSLIGEATVHCTTEDKTKGIWKGPVPECQGDCGPPRTFPNTRIRQNVQQSSPVGTRITYACIPGYEMTPGTRFISECLPSSSWSEVSITCQGRRCPIPNIENGRIAGESDLRLGDRITFICDEGHRVIGHNGARCVLYNNQVVWDRDPPLCQRIPCYPPPNIDNGRYNELHDYVYGSAVTYRCDSPFSLIGSSTIVCIYDTNQNGKWSAPAPECRVVTCKMPDVPNGLMRTSYKTSYTYQDRIVFECKPGFKLKDNRGDSTCEADSTWQPPLPECLLDTHPTVPPGGDGGNVTSAGSTVQTPVGSTVKPTDETTKTEIGHTEAPELPTDEQGPNLAVQIAVGTVVAVAVFGIIAAVLAYKAYHKRRGKTVNRSAPESYTAVPRNTDIPLRVKA
ncbi:membrane cofactor protein-like isoform X3 [Paroedura picta]|uniref:membrane cofactor protein-like isoform X3 n=1 Tax=Paroedura picta TaxID=143630 RepID=UPI0040576F06